MSSAFFQVYVSLGSGQEWSGCGYGRILGKRGGKGRNILQLREERKKGPTGRGKYQGKERIGERGLQEKFG